MAVDIIKMKRWLVLGVLAAAFFSPTPSFAAIAFRGAVAANNAGGDVQLVFSNLPTGTMAGDILIVSVTAVGGTGTTITPPSNWTLLNRTDSTTDLAQAIYFRIYSYSGLGNSFVFNSTVKASGTMVAISGARKVVLGSAQYGGQSYASSTTFTAPALGSWSSQNGMQILFGGLAYGSTTNTAASGFTKAAEAASTNNGAASRTTSAAQYQSVSAATTAGSVSQTTFWTNAAVQVNHQVFVFEAQTPTITPNTADTSAFGSSTPTLEFTGTEAANSDEIRYNVQIDTSNLFNTTADNGTPVVDTNYNESNTDLAHAVNSTYQYKALAQCFTSNGGNLVKAQFYLDQTTASGDVTAKLYAETHSIAFGTDSKPTGSALATSTPVNASTIPASPEFSLIDFYFSPYTLTNGTNYCISVEYPSTSGYIGGTIDVSSPTASGNGAALQNSNGQWTPLGDVPFYIYVGTSGPVLNKISNRDTGFANTVTGGDTDPFNSGEKSSFTVQAGNALPNGTYYWRTQAYCPADGTYSAWSTTRSFTISGAPSSYRVRHKVINSP